MRAVIYARYSTDKQRAESIEDQVRECRARCAREGFVVAGVYSDAAISGGTARRPGYQSMLAAARRRDFQFLVAEDTSRLWRNTAEQEPRKAELLDLGIHVVTGNLDTRQKGAALMSAITGAMSQQYRDDIGEKSRRGMKGNALARRPTGGKAYGYRSLSRPDGSRYVEIVPEQAAVVRRIFEAYAAGDSPKRIAAALNAEGIPSPGADWSRKERRTDRKWMGNAIGGDPEKGTGILCNTRYTGRIRWARTKWTRSAADSARRRVQHLAAAEVEYVDESLRIVPDALWNRVQARRRSTHAERKGKGPGGDTRSTC
jgi:DNA invertase Pin-like site-specific DNA recombinase